MSCPQCGGDRTEVLKTFYRGHSTYRVKRCCFCKARFSTQGYHSARVSSLTTEADHAFVCRRSLTFTDVADR